MSDLRQESHIPRAVTEDSLLCEVISHESVLWTAQYLLNTHTAAPLAKTRIFTLGVLNPVPLKDHSNLNAESRQEAERND